MQLIHLSKRPGSGEISGTTVAAFTLLEVMIAVAIFFMATFAILNLVGSSVRAARSLEPFSLDASSVVAELSLTNRLEEGEIPRDIIKHFEDMYPGYTCGGSITEIRTNGLFEVELLVGGITAGHHVVASSSKVLLFRPASGSRGPSGLQR